jgi:hypothetical protein
MIIIIIKPFILVIGRIKWEIGESWIEGEIISFLNNWLLFSLHFNLKTKKFLNYLILFLKYFFFFLIQVNPAEIKKIVNRILKLSSQL